MLSPQALLQQVGQQPLEFLREGAVDLPARQRTLRDTIAWSHSLLSAECKVLFARLAVFSGSADLEAIEQVTNSEGRLDILELIAEWWTRAWCRLRARRPSRGSGCLS